MQLIDTSHQQVNIDAQINRVDSAGDEGAIFASLVLGEELSAETLAQLQAEDDSQTIANDNLIGGYDDSAYLTRLSLLWGEIDDIWGD